MDQTTQQNAAMVEQSNAAFNTLTNEAVRLRDIVSQFRLAGTGPPASTRLAHGRETPHASPARALYRKIASAFNGNAALDPTSEWTEF